ncbi:MAG: glycoside hydrolase family 2 TIM barrel-domain containing protein [Candidatus Omnitrophota bacterium]|nr:glycoside hydrolase family 2 TIM barrel-domain containing protein [Candidatus Omnitrophota bacterium]
MRCFFALLFLFFSTIAHCTEVKIDGEEGAWQLLVDGAPFYINGAGCGLHKGKGGEDYLKLAKELGANTVRTWGIDQGTEEYLEKARKYGIYVCAGIWINSALPEKGVSYFDIGYKRKKEKEVLDYVERYKGHDAILIWGVGNECIFFTQDEDEKIALAKFINYLAEKIHKIDPKHPVMYTGSNYVELKYIKEYMPSVDIIGMNVYPTLRPCHGTYLYLKMNKPYALSEFGPPIASQSRKEENGAAIELNDKAKAIWYRELCSQIEEFRGFNLGGFVFHLGETTQESMTWWNINYSMFKRLPFWVVYEFYTGKKPLNMPPQIKLFTLDRASVKPGEIIDVRFFAEDEEKDRLRYEIKLSTTHEGILQYYVNDFIDVSLTIRDGAAKVELPSKKGLYRVYLFAYDNKGNVSSASKTISVD